MQDWKSSSLVESNALLLIRTNMSFLAMKPEPDFRCQLTVENKLKKVKYFIEPYFHNIKAFETSLVQVLENLDQPARNIKFKLEFEVRELCHQDQQWEVIKI